MQLESHLQQSSRLGILRPLEQSRARELLLLISMGVLAAVLSTFLKTHLKIPGHAILKVVLPISFGFAAVPKRHSGSVMGFTALCCGLLFRWTIPASGGSLGVGALTSLVLFGPLIDICLRYVKRPVSAWFLLALAGSRQTPGRFWSAAVSNFSAAMMLPNDYWRTGCLWPWSVMPFPVCSPG